MFPSPAGIALSDFYLGTQSLKRKEGEGGRGEGGRERDLMGGGNDWALFVADFCEYCKCAFCVKVGLCMTTKLRSLF
jgi:hypothetical protein